MTSADQFFWTYEQAVSYYQFTLIHYMGFSDKGILLAGGCGDINSPPQIKKTDWFYNLFKRKQGNIKHFLVFYL